MATAETLREEGRRADLRRLSLQHMSMRLQTMQEGETLENRLLLATATTAIQAAMSSYKQQSMRAFSTARCLDHQALTGELSLDPHATP